MIKLDHVVYFTAKSPKEVVKEQKAIGRHAVIGGSHERWGTYNALMYVKNAYVEWLSIEDKAVAEKANHPLPGQLLHDGEGWGTLCFSVHAIEMFNEKLQMKGFQTSGVLSAERKTVHGEVRKWKMLFVDQPISEQLPLPFFIEWEEEEAVRLEKLRADGTILPESAQLEIKECVFRVENPMQEASVWATLLSTNAEDGQLHLPNVILKFIETKERERLSEVLIGRA